MNTYYVAAGFRWILVDAISKDQARVLATPKLLDLYADRIEQFGDDFKLEIHTVRLATQQEKDQMEFHNRMVALHSAN